MSDETSGPGARPKRSVRASHDKDGRVSPAPVLTFGPTFTGVDHASSVLERVETQTSWPPCPPGRFEVKTISRQSLRTFGWMSFAAGSFSSETGAAEPKPLHPSRLT